MRLLASGPFFFRPVSQRITGRSERRVFVSASATGNVGFHVLKCFNVATRELQLEVGPWADQPHGYCLPLLGEGSGNPRLAQEVQPTLIE